MARSTTTKTNADDKIPANNSKLQAYDELIKKLNKNIQSDTGTLIAKLGDRPLEVETISTGSLVLDSILGGGIPRGRLIEIYGPESSGKTSIGLVCVGNVQKMGGTAAFIDLENALDPAYALKLGVDVNNLAVSQPDNAEQAFTLIFHLVQSGLVDIIVVDSIASMVPKAELEGDMEQQTIGLLARLMSKALRQLVSAANRTNTTVIFINQTRDAIGTFSSFGTPQTTSGGRAMRFYASQRIEVKRKGIIKEGNDAIGTEVKFKIAKNKIAPPFKEGTTILTFGHGISRANEMIEEGKKYANVISMPNNRTYVEAETGEIIGKSRSETLERLENDEELLDRLSKALQKAIQDNLFKYNDNDKKSEADSEKLNDDDFDEAAEDEEEL